MNYYRAYNYGSMCPYCGGMHPPEHCPMYPPPPADMPMMGMEEMMMYHTELLEHIKMRVDEIHHMCEELHMGNAKG